MSNRSFASDQNQTIQLFSGIVRPLLLQLPGITEIVQLEKAAGVTDSMESRFLDLNVGADYMLISKHLKGLSVIRLLASRIQQGWDFDTFTVRYERRTGTLTEYIKRQIALAEDYCFPQLTLQAYITDYGTVRNACLVQTRSLYAAIEKGLAEESLLIRETPKGKNWEQRFIVLPFDRLGGKRIVFNQTEAIEYQEVLPATQIRRNLAA